MWGVTPSSKAINSVSSGVGPSEHAIKDREIHRFGALDDAAGEIICTHVVLANGSRGTPPDPHKSSRCSIVSILVNPAAGPYLLKWKKGWSGAS